MDNYLPKKQVTAHLKNEMRSSQLKQSLCTFEPNCVIKEEETSLIGVPLLFSDNKSDNKNKVLELETLL